MDKTEIRSRPVYFLHLHKMIFILLAIALLLLIIYNRPKRLACIYAYYEKDGLYRDNLLYFLNNGMNIRDMDYYLVVNGKCTVPIPPSIKVLYRENKGYDFGAWSDAIASFPISDYDYVFFINSSVRGPYIPDWTTPFQKRFKGDTKLVGTSINIAHPKGIKGTRPVYPHVQSMFFCLDREALLYLKSQGFFDTYSTTFREAILEKEIGMSLMILDRGWNIDSVLSRYQGIDYRKIDHDINPTSFNGDPYYRGAYFGGTIAPEEAIFFKIARFAY